jgi:uncharacterized membrane protein YdbT with pleckstrin-like domain
MSYVDAVLQKNETVLHRGRLHWIVYLRGVLLLVLAAVLLLLLPVAQGWQVLVNWLAILAAALSVPFLVHAWYDQWITEVAVTDRRIIYKRGLIRRMTAEMNLEKVESVNVVQSILGRILDYGTIDVRGTGGGIEGVGGIAQPLAFRSAITAR